MNSFHLLELVSDGRYHLQSYDVDDHHTICLDQQVHLMST